MARGQLDALRRHQIDQRVVILAWRHDIVHGIDHLLVLLRAGHRQHTRVYGANHACIDAHAAGDDDLAVFLDRFADHFQRLGLGRVDEAAGIDHNHVGVLVGRNDFVTFHAQLGQDAFGVNERLGATQRNESDLGGGWRGDGGHGKPRREGHLNATRRHRLGARCASDQKVRNSSGEWPG
ncbi:hypothetical protein ALP75_204828 [Pseudomonas syringae pv. actinidiae]|nr:hypothetical protein ALP75_204828 [Pseudomonas syringae pv. actinidiae]